MSSQEYMPLMEIKLLNLHFLRLDAKQKPLPHAQMAGTFPSVSNFWNFPSVSNFWLPNPAGSEHQSSKHVSMPGEY